MAFVELFGSTMPVEAAIVLVGELIVAVLIAIAFYLATTHRGTYHHWLMLSAFLVDELLLKGIMAQKLLSGVLGVFPYEGTPGLAHLALSAACTVSGIGVIFLGFRHRVTKDSSMFLPPKGRRLHKTVGFLYILTWTATFVVGMRIFGTFYL